jgi:hypothetical protein
MTTGVQLCRYQRIREATWPRLPDIIKETPGSSRRHKAVTVR